MHLVKWTKVVPMEMWKGDQGTQVRQNIRSRSDAIHSRLTIEGGRDPMHWAWGAGRGEGRTVRIPIRINGDAAFTHSVDMQMLLR